ncbi:MAG: helix-turn-helix domain-containing protein [Actinomycetota bacterium]|nr:helix-turn-helix domain-containing protein [Actinomycetota bacterium]
MLSLGIGRRVKELREERGLTLSALAERAGLSSAAVSRIERGLRTPGAETVEKLARGLNRDPGDLFAFATFGLIRGEPVPQTIDELLAAANVEGKELARSYDNNTPGHISELFEGLSYEQVQALAWRIVKDRRAVKATIDRYLNEPGITPNEKRVLQLLDVKTMQVNLIAILEANQAAEREAEAAKENGDTEHAEAIERDKSLLLAQVGG